MNYRLLASLLLVAALPSAGCLDLEALGRISGGIHGAAQEGLGTGIQGAFGSGVTLQALTASGFGGGLSLEMEYAWASPVVDLVSYRGYAGGRLALFGAWQLGRQSSMLLAPGLRAGVMGSYSRYLATDLHFVAPGLFLEPTVSLRIRRIPWLVLEAALPVVWSRRADLRFSGEVGLAIGVGALLPVAKAAPGGGDE